jgi:hypothetical protein
MAKCCFGLRRAQSAAQRFVAGMTRNAFHRPFDLRTAAGSLAQALGAVAKRMILGDSHHGRLDGQAAIHQ